MKLFNTLLFTLILIVAMYIITSKIKKTHLEKYVNIDQIADNTGVKTWSDWEIKYGETLKDKGGNPDTSKNKLDKCEGDCDTDSDCKPGLKCFQRSSSSNVPPGCVAGGPGDDPTHDYCYDPDDKLPACNNYLNMTNNTSIAVTNSNYNTFNNENLDDINNVRKVLYGTNEENLNKDEYTMCNLNLCVDDDGLPSKKEVKDYDIKIKNYFEKIQALEDFKSKIEVLIINGYIPFLHRLLLLVGQLKVNNNIRIYKRNDKSIENKIDVVLNKAKVTFLDILNNWINTHSQKDFLEELKSNINTNITHKANNISNQMERETKLLSLSILDTPNIKNKLTNSDWETELLDSSDIYSKFKSFFVLDYFNELKNESDKLRNKTKTEMNRLKECESHGRIVGTAISEVGGGQCVLDSNASIEQKISSCNKICISQTDCNYYTLDGNKCLLYKHFKEIVPRDGSMSFKSLKGCNKDKWTVKTLVNSYSGNRKNTPHNQVMIDMDGPIGKNASGTYDFSYAFWIYINNDSQDWRAILRRGPNYPFYSPGQTHKSEKQRQPGIWLWPGRTYGDFNRSSETDNYSNGRSLHFRFGLEGTGNWNRGIDVPAWTYGGLPLVDKGNNPNTSKNKLGKCEGDCDSDNDCKPGLKCFERSSSKNVPPGCKPGGSGDDPTHDYCYDPNDPNELYKRETIKPKTWHHVVFTVKDSKEFSAYVDGVRRSHTITEKPIATDFNDNFPITMGGGNETESWGGYPASNNDHRAPSQHPGFLVRNVQVFRNTLDEKYIVSLMKSDIERGVKETTYEQFENYSKVKTALDVRNPKISTAVKESANQVANKQHNLWGVGNSEHIMARAAKDGKIVSSNSSIHECNSPSNQVDMMYINTPKTFKDAKNYCKKIGRNLLKFVHPEADGEGRCGGRTNCDKNEGIEKANRINAFKYYQAVDLLNKGRNVGRTSNDIWIDGSDADWNKPNDGGTINREGTFLNDNLTLTHMGSYDGLLPLVDKGGNPDTSQNKLGKCEGDCDSDNDCKPGLKCFERSSSKNVPPGCKPGGSGDDPTHDYCYDPNYNNTYGNKVNDSNSVSYWNNNEPNDWGNSEDCIQMSPMWGTPNSGLKMNDLNCENKKPFICEKELLDPINLSTNACKDDLKLQNFEKRMGLDPNANRFQKCQQFSHRYGVKAGSSWGCIENNALAKTWWSGKHSEKHGHGKPISYEDGCTTTTKKTVHDGCDPSSSYYLGLKIREGKTNKWNPDTSVNKLGMCEGDCDKDSDCKPDMKCFQRSGNTSVPGCTTDGSNNWRDADYCIHKYKK